MKDMPSDNAHAVLLALIVVWLRSNASRWTAIRTYPIDKIMLEGYLPSGTYCTMTRAQFERGMALLRAQREWLVSRSGDQLALAIQQYRELDDFANWYYQ